METYAFQSFIFYFLFQIKTSLLLYQVAHMETHAFQRFIIIGYKKHNSLSIKSYEMLKCAVIKMILSFQ